MGLTSLGEQLFDVFSWTEEEMAIRNDHFHSQNIV